MIKKILVFAAVLTCPVLASAQTCHPYAMPDTLQHMGYAQYSQMAQEEKLPSPPTQEAFQDMIEAVQHALCTLDTRAQDIGPLPADFHYKPSPDVQQQKSYLDPRNQSHTEQILNSPDARRNIEYLLKRPLLAQMISALSEDVDYRKQEMSARYEAAHRPVPEDLDNTVQQATLQAVKQVPYTLGAGSR